MCACLWPKIVKYAQNLRNMHKISTPHIAPPCGHQLEKKKETKKTIQSHRPRVALCHWPAGPPWALGLRRRLSSEWMTYDGLSSSVRVSSLTPKVTAAIRRARAGRGAERGNPQGEDEAWEQTCAVWGKKNLQRSILVGQFRE